MIVRPHHSLCMQFFIGKGYDSHFIANTRRLLEELSADDPLVTLTVGCDEFCRACPENTGGICREQEKVEGIDRRALLALGLSDGDEIRWSGLLSLAKERIIVPGRLPEICGNCKWSMICNNKEYDL